MLRFQLTLLGTLVLVTAVRTATGGDPLSPLDEPVPVSLQTRDGEDLEETITHFTIDRFVLNDHQGERHELAWAQVPAETAFGVYRQAMVCSDAGQWFELGRQRARPGH